MARAILADKAHRLVHRPDIQTELIALEDITVLGLLSRPRPILHQLRPAAARFVHETDLHAIPDSPPRLLRSPFLVEARRPETGEVLWGDTVALGGYPLDDDGLRLIGIVYPANVAIVTTWWPRWTGENVAVGAARSGSAVLDRVSAHPEWSHEASRFALLLGLLLDAEGVPFRTEFESPSGRRRGKTTADPPKWTIRHIYLNEARLSPSADETVSSADLDDRISEHVIVRGHLKRQRFGPGRSQVRWIYVASYEARRWVAPRPAQVIVHEPRRSALN